MTSILLNRNDRRARYAASPPHTTLGSTTHTTTSNAPSSFPTMATTPQPRTLPTRLGHPAAGSEINAATTTHDSTETARTNMAAPTTTITITTYNVVSARGTKLLEALRAMKDLNTDIAILTEAKLTGDRHARMGHGFHVFATNASSPSKGGIVLAWRAGQQHWTLEGMRAVSANTISATLVTGNQRWLLLGTYLTPNEPPDDELDRIETEFRRHPHLPVILLGDLNADIDDATDERSIAIATTLQHLGTIDVLPRFHQKNRRRHTRHRHLPDGSHQCTRCDYALVDPTIPVKSLRIVIPPATYPITGQ